MAAAKKRAPAGSADLSKRMAAQENQINQMANIVSNLADTVVSIKDSVNAINRPAIVGQYNDSEDHDQGPSGYATVEMHTDKDGEVHQEIVRPAVADVNDPLFKEKADIDAFFNEKVRVHIADTAEKKAAPSFNIWVNGKPWTFVRNREYTVPRYVVEGLARAKPVNYGNEEFTNPDTGLREFRYPESRGVRYAFAVKNDSKRGDEWLQQVLREA